MFSLDRYVRGFVRGGVPADVVPAPPNELVLNLQELLNLLAVPALFFEMNPAFQPYREVTESSLRELARDGIITLPGVKSVRHAGCGGCLRRKLLSFAVNWGARFQHVVTVLIEQPDRFEKLKQDLRQFFERQNPGRRAPGTNLVLYARGKDNAVKRIEL